MEQKEEKKDANAKVLELEHEKEALIHRYMEMQDQADDLNGQIYQVCCSIEVLNRRIEQARDELKKQQAKAVLKTAAGGNGNGNGHPK
jgi:hypothetical protein